MNNSPLGELGQQIIIGNMIYGFITDLNNNGRDEIYLYSFVENQYRASKSIEQRSKYGEWDVEQHPVQIKVNVQNNGEKENETVYFFNSFLYKYP